MSLRTTHTTTYFTCRWLVVVLAIFFCGYPCTACAGAGTARSHDRNHAGAGWTGNYDRSHTRAEWTGSHDRNNTGIIQFSDNNRIRTADECDL